MTISNKTKVALIALAFAAGAHAQTPAGSAERGRALVQTCQGCHGIEGWRTAFPEVYSVPKLGGQHAQSLVNALQAYKSGARAHPSMKAIAASLTEQDMADLAAYYAQPSGRAGGLLQTSTIVAGAEDLRAGAAKAKEVCATCHGMDGGSQQPDYPKLGGQYADYLAKALQDYKSGRRKNAIMQGFASGLSGRDIQNLGAYYASQPAVVSTKR